MNKTVIKSLILIIVILISIIVILKTLPEVKKTCKDFSNRKEVESYFTKNKAVWLDRDKDGIPCELIK